MTDADFVLAGAKGVIIGIALVAPFIFAMYLYVRIRDRMQEVKSWNEQAGFNELGNKTGLRWEISRLMWKRNRPGASEIENYPPGYHWSWKSQWEATHRESFWQWTSARRA